MENWNPSGEAFLGQPIVTKLAEKRKGRSFFGSGKYSVGTFEKTAKRPLGDKAVGSLTSMPFKIMGSNISFRIGGGDNSSQTSVQLLVEDRVVLEERDRGIITEVEAMVPVVWEVPKWRGKTAQIRINDLSERGWGHINVDDFRMR